jgi:hypothetical protein
MDPPSTYADADRRPGVRRRLRDARTLPSRDRFAKEFLGLPNISQNQIDAGSRRLPDCHDLDDAFVPLLKR